MALATGPTAQLFLLLATVTTAIAVTVLSIPQAPPRQLALGRLPARGNAIRPTQDSRALPRANPDVGPGVAQRGGVRAASLAA